jgi:hypothetical protein
MLKRAGMLQPFVMMKNRLTANAILAENPLYYPSLVLRAGLLALEDMSKEQRLIIMKAATKARNTLTFL